MMVESTIRYSKSGSSDSAAKIQAVNILSDDPARKFQAFAQQRAASYIPNLFGVALDKEHRGDND
jgi:hypothetical protein